MLNEPITILEGAIALFAIIMTIFKVAKIIEKNFQSQNNEIEQLKQRIKSLEEQLKNK